MLVTWITRALMPAARVFSTTLTTSGMTSGLPVDTRTQTSPGGFVGSIVW